MNQLALMMLTARMEPGDIVTIAVEEFVEAAGGDLSKFETLRDEDVRAFVETIRKNWLVDVEWPPSPPGRRVGIAMRERCACLMRVPLPEDRLTHTTLQCALPGGHDGPHKPPVLLPVPDGIYDNRARMRRELWRNGKCGSWMTSSNVAESRAFLRPPWNCPWGAHADHPNPDYTSDAKPARNPARKR